jgi:hypothetical protein
MLLLRHLDLVSRHVGDGTRQVRASVAGETGCVRGDGTRALSECGRHRVG